jgi:hypothetical protein
MIVIELDGFLDGGVQSVQRVCFLNLDDAAARCLKVSAPDTINRQRVDHRLSTLLRFAGAFGGLDLNGIRRWSPLSWPPST